MEQTLPNKKKLKMAHQNLPLCLLGDTFSGLLSALTVAPFCTIVDKSIIQNANGSVPLWQAVGKGLKQLFFKPVTFGKRKQFHLLYLVYGSTYFAANTSESICQSQDIDPVLPKLITTFLVNTCVGIYKDKTLTQIFGTTEVKKFPMVSYGLFWFRDIITIACAFTLPKIFGKKLSDNSSLSLSTSTKVFQIACPLLIQFIATPIHLLGLDYYNTPGKKLTERLSFVKSVAGYSIVLRMLRFLPAYGLAGVLNITIRDKFQQMYAQSR